MPPLLYSSVPWGGGRKKPGKGEKRGGGGEKGISGLGGTFPRAPKKKKKPEWPPSGPKKKEKKKKQGKGSCAPPPVPSALPPRTSRSPKKKKKKKKKKNQNLPPSSRGSKKKKNGSPPACFFLPRVAFSAPRKKGKREKRNVKARYLRGTGMLLEWGLFACLASMKKVGGKWEKLYLFFHFFCLGEGGKKEAEKKRGKN